MAVKKRIDPKIEVSQFIDNLEPNFQEMLTYLRKLMLSIDPNIAEQIKWNSPSFYYTGPLKAFDPKTYQRDILVTNLRKKTLLCILPTGQKIKKNVQLLEGEYTDGRRMITFENLADLQKKETLIRDLMIEWLELLDRE
ncbi:MAG: DUF1801 domain-containing protein [Bacteroidetes bacterium]|nr:DUF1801 domain-containing protein [Bacteroidota bacterium]